MNEQQMMRRLFVCLWITGIVFTVVDIPMWILGIWISSSWLWTAAVFTVLGVVPLVLAIGWTTDKPPPRLPTKSERKNATEPEDQELLELQKQLKEKYLEYKAGVRTDPPAIGRAVGEVVDDAIVRTKPYNR